MKSRVTFDITGLNQILDPIFEFMEILIFAGRISGDRLSSSPVHNWRYDQQLSPPRAKIGSDEGSRAGGDEHSVLVMLHLWVHLLVLME